MPNSQNRRRCPESHDPPLPPRLPPLKLADLAPCVNVAGTAAKRRPVPTGDPRYRPNLPAEKKIRRPPQNRLTAEPPGPILGRSHFRPLVAAELWRSRTIRKNYI